MKLYRIEHADTLNGMWTHRIGNGLVLHLLTDPRLATMPMPDDSTFRTDGLVWKTAVPDITTLYEWFTRQDIIDMLQHGFALKCLECDNVIIQPNQILFDDSRRLVEVDMTVDFLSDRMG